MLRAFLSGAITLAALAVAMFFWRFRRTTRDRLFGLFAIAFLLLGIEQIAILCSERFSPGPYVIRLSAFLLILFAVLDKNRSEKRRP